MAKQTEIGNLAINLKIKLDALEKGIDTAKKKLQEIEKQNTQVQNSNKGLDASFMAMSVSIIASLVKIKSALDDGVAEYTKYKNSMMTVNKVAQNTGITLNEVQDIINNSNEFKLMNESDLNAAIKNLLLYGYTAEQATDILKRLQDSAVGNRQECYSLSEAVRVTTEGIRMENSVTSDAAGVQKNIAKMYEEHAEKLGKTTDSLTQAEKAQAVYNGIMEETAPIVGSAAQIAREYEGQQAQANAELLKTKQLLGESLIPTYNELSKVQKNILSGLNSMIKNNKSATAGIVTFTTVLLASSVAIIGVRKAITAFSTATGIANTTTKALTASLMANPLFWGGLAISIGTAALNAFNTEMQKTIGKTKELTTQSENVSSLLENFRNNNFTYTEAEVAQATDIKQQTQEIVNSYEERNNKIKELEQQKQDIINKFNSGEIMTHQKDASLNTLNTQLYNAKEELKKFEKEFIPAGHTIDLFKNRINALNQTLDWNSNKQKYNTLTNTQATRQKLIDIAQTKADIDGKKQLLNVLKEGKTTTDKYKEAKSQLVKVYPELANVNENTIANTEALINTEEKAAQKEWDMAQSAIQNSIAELEAMKNNDELVQNIAVATQQKVDDVRASIEQATNSLIQLSGLSVGALATSSAVTSNFKPKSTSGGGSYQNKRLDNYKKEIEHKKALDQITLKEEIQMYEYALKKYAKTTDEKRELREKIYDLNKELAQKEKELLEQQTEDYEAYMQEQKNLRGAAYNVDEQTRDYDKIIQMHKSYLNQIMKDERLSLEERKDIYREELQTIRDYEQQKRDLRIQAIDDTTSQLTNAITKQLEEAQQKEKDIIDKQIEEIEKLKEIRINAINAEYDAKIEAIEKELEALDKAEQQKTRDEEDAEYEKKKKRLEELVAYEHDATTKANYQKELDKLLEEHQKVLDDRNLTDKKEALSNEKELLKQEQDEKIQKIETETEKIKEQYQKQLQALEECYDKQIAKAQETAQTMLLNVEQNQNEILTLLQSYGDAYEITGQTFGEKLGQSFADTAMEKIQNAISEMRRRIDEAIANNIARLQSATASVQASGVTGERTVSKTISVQQHNTITSPVDSPSTAYKKYETLNRNLASQIASIF